MAILQVSRITQRKGLQDDLPALAGAEFGWSVDTRRLFIGNGTLAEGAPVVGNTEVLTQYSDVLNLINYTYAGLAGGYVVDTGPTQRTLQSRLDDYANVKDFGAVGDGVTDDTVAINRALQELLCVNAAYPATRRSLFFPAGNYIVSDTIYIPPFVTMYGEGNESSYITLQSGSVASYLLQTCDSMYQTGVNMGTNGAIAPQAMSIANMGFVVEDELDIVLLDSVKGLEFSKCNFVGPMTTGTITPLSADVACIRFANNAASFPIGHITFNGCLFQGLTRGFNNTVDCTDVTVNTSKFNVMLQGASLGTAGVSTQLGFKFTSNMFDNIAQEGLFFGLVSGCMSAYNIFLDVGNNFAGSGNPISACIEFVNGNNVSVGDMFERDDTDDALSPRIQLNYQGVFAIDNGSKIKFGTYTQLAGELEVIDIYAVPFVIKTFDTALTPAFKIEYQFEDATNGTIRYGTFTAVSSGTSGTPAYNDAIIDSGPIGLQLEVDQVGTAFTLQYTSTSEGILKYSISQFS